MEAGYANGMDDLAAQFVVAFKQQIGDVYCTHSDAEEEFNYKVTEQDGTLLISVDNVPPFTPSQFLENAERIERAVLSLTD